MGMLDDAKETAQAVGREVGREVEDGVDRLKDWAEEKKADAKVAEAEAERDSVHRRNDLKEELRD